MQARQCIVPLHCEVHAGICLILQLQKQNRHLPQTVSRTVDRDLLGMAAPQVWVPPPLVEGARALLAAAEQCGGHDMPCTIAPFQAWHAPRTSLIMQKAHGRLHASKPSILESPVVPSTTAFFSVITACPPIDDLAICMLALRRCTPASRCG